MRGYASISAEIRRLARERDAVILAHNYQRPEVQDVADYVGDSLGLSRQATATSAKIIVFAGVHFMAETAKILSPEKTVLLPEPLAGCPMADMMTAGQLAKWRKANPGVPVVTYVNSTAAVKALSDVCVTSANAVSVVRSLAAPKVLFGPDRNLASWVARALPEVEIVPWEGYCPIHENVSPEQVRSAIEAHPEAEVLVHPECRPEVVEMADAVLSTSQMIAHAASSDARAFIVVTEEGLLHALSKAAEGRRFHHIQPAMLCPNMKVTTLAKVRDSLALMQHPIEVDDDVRLRALGAVERMITIG